MLLWVGAMRSVTTPLFPAQVAGAVTLQDVIDAREGNRLPLDLAVYLAAELGKQAAQLKALGRQFVLDPKRVWCTSKGAVVVHEAIDAPSESRGLGRLIYRLLSGSGDVSAWPPSYFNPSVAQSLDAAVMSAVSDEQPEDLGALVDALNAASSGLDSEAAVAGMARLVFAVPDERPSVEQKAAPELETSELPVVRRAWLNPWRGTALAAAIVVLLGIALSFSGGSPEVAPGAAPVVAPVVVPPRQKTVEAFRAKQLLKGATAKSQRGRAKAK